MCSDDVSCFNVNIMKTKLLMSCHSQAQISTTYFCIQIKFEIFGSFYLLCTALYFLGILDDIFILSTVKFFVIL